MRNIWRQFEDILPSQRKLYTEVVQVRASEGTSIVRTGEGRQFRVKGTGIPAGSFAYVIGDKIDGPAPALPSSTQLV